ncbi:MAG TPA: 50S ribosomal protein L27 [Candidatus Tyrphobacter sp.]|nr:50S ribosomal protein L27 [Candidatus Tyrphobacter sp.]
MAHTKSGGSTKLGRESASKRLGLKRGDGENVAAGQIIVRQRGTRYLVGQNVKIGADDTIYAAKNGKVKYSSRLKTKFDGRKKRATVVNVVV